MQPSRSQPYFTRPLFKTKMEMKMGPASEGPQVPDKETKATMGTENAPGGKASPDPQDVRPSVFHSIKLFVLCHSVLQLAQLMISGYLKSSISTVEKRFGLSSQTSGLLASFNEVGNTALIVFVSYFGSRVHRPRLIGCGAILVSLAGLLMTLPHFISEPYRYDSTSPENTPQDFEASLCLPTASAPAPAPTNGNCSSSTEAQHLGLVGIMFVAQTLLGVGGVPIQPFGISYIDDFAHNSNSPLYLGILFAVTMMGPGLAFGLGSLMLRLYVDINRMPEGGISLTIKDPRWVGAWWLGFLIAAGTVALAAIPYFFFPKEMPKEKHELQFRRKVLAVTDSPARKGKDSPTEQRPGESTKKQDGPVQIAPNLTVIQFIKVFPKVLLQNLRHPTFLLVVLSQVCLSSMAAGMATFLPKFLERQFFITASYANLLIGCLSFPSIIMGIVVGGVLVKRLHLGPVGCSVLCLLGMLLCLFFSLPLFFIGCPSHQIAGITHQPGAQPGLELFPGCMEACSCQSDGFNPVCDPNARVEYITPCHAGCSSRVVQDALDKSQSPPTSHSPAGHQHPSPRLLQGETWAAPAGAEEPVDGFLHQLQLRGGGQPCAGGILRLNLQPPGGALPAAGQPGLGPGLFDPHTLFPAHPKGSEEGRQDFGRGHPVHVPENFGFIGLQFFYKIGSMICFALVLAVLRQQTKEARTKESRSIPGLEQQLLVSEPGKKSEDSRV
ncbi:solute carrier organic anion transporter family member 2B1 isoform X2 [Saimiri boliviensis]|uniref:solute carrier organic anion transporter family member 2B1 isoform X2 n=1 Tax=Saimiri boliviensis TaxID=27679 RepID=UPI003D772ABF